MTMPVLVAVSTEEDAERKKKEKKKNAIHFFFFFFSHSVTSAVLWLRIAFVSLTACDLGVRILLQARVQHGVRDLIAQLVRMAGRHRLGSEKKRLKGKKEENFFC
jgi:hypothetical protein